jgi:hypothetical protein
VSALLQGYESGWKQLGVIFRTRGARDPTTSSVHVGIVLSACRLPKRPSSCMSHPGERGLVSLHGISTASGPGLDFPLTGEGGGA